MLNNNSTIKSVLWSGVDRFAAQSIQFVISILIARQLAPTDYGIVALLTIFLSVAQTFIDSGFSQALIQKQNRTTVDLSTVLYFNIAVGIFLYFCFVVCAPIISKFYQQPLLNSMIVVVGLNFIVNSFGTVQRALVSINFEFKKMAYISVLSVVLSGVSSLYLAYADYGAWTLVYQNLIYNSIIVVLLWLTSKWRPSIAFSENSFIEMFSFGSKLLASNIIHKIYVNIYNVIIGKVFPLAELGFFNRAYTLTTYPSNTVTMVISRVLYPIECKIQNQNDLLSQKFLSYITIVCIFFFPLMMGVSGLADPLIRVALTNKWENAIVFCQILCFAFMFDPIMGLSADLLSVKKCGDYVLKSEMLKKIAAVLILICTIQYSVTAICYGLVLYSLCDVVIIVYFIKKVLPQINYITLIKTLAPIFISSIIMYIVLRLFILLEFNMLLKLFLGVLLGLITYLVVGILLMPKQLKSVLDIVKSIKE